MADSLLEQFLKALNNEHSTSNGSVVPMALPANDPNDPRGPRGMPYTERNLPEVYPAPPVDSFYGGLRGPTSYAWPARNHPDTDFGNPLHQAAGVARKMVIAPLARMAEEFRDNLQGSPEDHEWIARQGIADRRAAGLPWAPPPAPLLPPGYQESREHVPALEPLFDDHPWVAPTPLDNLIPPGLSEEVLRSSHKGASPGTLYGPRGAGHFIDSPLHPDKGADWYDTTTQSDIDGPNSSPPLDRPGDEDYVPQSMVDRFGSHFGLQKGETALALEAAVRAWLGR